MARQPTSPDRCRSELCEAFADLIEPRAPAHPTHHVENCRTGYVAICASLMGCGAAPSVPADQPEAPQARSGADESLSILASGFGAIADEQIR